MWLWKNYVEYRLALRRQRRGQKLLDATYPPSEGDMDNAWMSEYVRKDDAMFEWKMLIHTEYLRNKADALDAQMPDITDPEMYGRVDWDDDPKQPYYLTEKGIRAAREAIRSEEKHRREAVGYWFGIAVGLIGAVTGLVSVFKG